MEATKTTPKPESGFKRGWAEAYCIPRRASARAAAARGFKKGFTNRYRSDKYANYRKSK